MRAAPKRLPVAAFKELPASAPPDAPAPRRRSAGAGAASLAIHSETLCTPGLPSSAPVRSTIDRGFCLRASFQCAHVVVSASAAKKTNIVARRTSPGPIACERSVLHRPLLSPVLPHLASSNRVEQVRRSHTTSICAFNCCRQFFPKQGRRPNDTCPHAMSSLPSLTLHYRGRATPRPAASCPTNTQSAPCTPDTRYTQRDRMMSA